jgi:hypothetical protein
VYQNTPSTVCVEAACGGYGRAACVVGRTEGGVLVRPAARVGDWGDRDEWGDAVRVSQ